MNYEHEENVFLCEFNGLLWKNLIRVSYLKNISNDVSKKWGWQGGLIKPRETCTKVAFTSVFKFLLYFKEIKTGISR